LIKPITVTHLITDLITAGAQKALYRLLLHTDRTNYRPIVIALRDGDSEIATQIRALGIPVLDLHMSPPWRFYKLLGLYRALRSQRPAILHCWMIHSNIIGRIVGRLAGVPTIIVSRRSDRNGGEIYTKLNRWLVNWSDGIIAVSESTRQAELAETGIAPERVETIPNGLDASAFNDLPSAADRQVLRTSLGITPDQILIGSVGRLTAAKGYPDLVRAFQIVTQEIPQACLIIVGKGKLEAELKGLAVELGISEKVQFTGVCSDIPKLLNAFDLFAFSSHWEGMPNALMEAMAAGLPCVATRVSAAPELIDDGVHGLLVPPQAPAQLANGILKLLDDAPLRKRLAVAGRERIQTEFTLEKTAAQTTALYEKCRKSTIKTC
jgi:glycosyltransferase involved in cell wall biosynthesis